MKPRDRRYSAPIVSCPTWPTFSLLPLILRRMSFVESRGMIWPMSCNSAAITSSDRAPGSRHC